VLLTDHGWPVTLALPAALITGLVIGFTLGFLVSKVGIPSFVVTLAAFLAFQGVLLILLGGGTNISIRDPFVLKLANGNLSVIASWALALIAILGFAAAQFIRLRGRAARGLVHDPMGIVIARIAGVAVVVLIATAILTQERSINPAVNSLKGIPIVVPIILVAAVILTFVLSRTTYGRHVYAVGGNTEAARRAGIPVDRVRISVFVICSFLAAVGGIIAASRQSSVDPRSGGSNVLLNAVAAAVIGGTSLFGGKGRIIDAILGGTVIAVIENGMALMNFSAGTKFAFTGVVLLLAAGVDALSRRRAAATGTR
jgi:D-xylose transport system permease protein